jgi:hypothetical protein
MIKNITYFPNLPKIYGSNANTHIHRTKWANCAICRHNVDLQHLGKKAVNQHTDLLLFCTYYSAIEIKEILN